MATTIGSRPNSGPTKGRTQLAGWSLLLGGIAFFIGGATHPRDSGTGNKVQQLHDMLVDPSWYRSHAVLLVAMVLLAAGILAVRSRPDLTPGVERLLQIVFVVACIAAVSMAVHLLAPLDADSIADGEQSLLSHVQTLNELIDAAWGLALASLAVVGGLTRTLGNRLTVPVGLVGGVAFALASATISFTDTFDSLFIVGSLLSVWAIIVGVIETRR